MNSCTASLRNLENETLKNRMGVGGGSYLIVHELCPKLQLTNMCATIFYSTISGYQCAILEKYPELAHYCTGPVPDITVISAKRQGQNGSTPAVMSQVIATSLWCWQWNPLKWLHSLHGEDVVIWGQHKLSCLFPCSAEWRERQLSSIFGAMHPGCRSPMGLDSCFSC